MIFLHRFYDVSTASASPRPFDFPFSFHRQQAQTLFLSMALPADKRPERPTAPTFSRKLIIDNNLKKQKELPTVMNSSCSNNVRRCRGRRLLGFSNTAIFYVFLLFLSWNDWSCKERQSSSSSCYCTNRKFLAAATAVTVSSSQDEGDDEASQGRRRRRLRTASVAADGKKSAKNMTLNEIFIRAGRRGIGGGVPGFVAGIVQVFSLMWLRTIMNYQCRYGTTFRQALKTLLNEGGIRRLYRGLSFALIQAPIARFVSTATNDGVESLLSNLNFTEKWGPGRTTFVASLVVGFWRVLLMPIDTMKTVLQVDSAEGFRSLMRRVKVGKIGVLYEGAIAYAFSAILGHYPWVSELSLVT